MSKHKKNKNSGITLIALVVTIIVLLLLAGISIQMLSGNVLNAIAWSKDGKIMLKYNKTLANTASPF